MKYVRAEAPFELEEAKGTLIQLFQQSPGSTTQTLYVKAQMVNELQSKKMVLLNDIKFLLPLPTKGIVLDRSHRVNVADIREISLYPSYFDELVEKGIITIDGDMPKEEKAKEKAEATSFTPEAVESSTSEESSEKSELTIEEKKHEEEQEEAETSTISEKSQKTEPEEKTEKVPEESTTAKEEPAEKKDEKKSEKPAAKSAGKNKNKQTGKDSSSANPAGE